ncbi:DEAD/DEAH box helicase family protein [Patescibacteria group bacterium]|nr:DEAD/DEAH box helicase family protein [Patescibacteria group bacterium]MBU4142063.1 DEAD/DEAH box helicase family protein [Patescibacteria group bacterium]
MAIKELKQYQEKAVEKLISRTRELLGEKLDKRTIVFQSPTGSGKTFMMSQYIAQLIDELKDDDLCFLWLSPGKGNLHEQSHKSLKKEFVGFPVVYLLEQEFVGSRRTIDKNEVIVGNWEKLSNKDGKTNEWKSKLMKDKETVNFRELIENTRNSKTKIILIIDESHSRDKAERAFELRNEIIKPDLTIEMSATPILHEGEYNERVEVQSNDVIEEGMIKKEIIINEDIDKVDDNEITSQELVMEMAYRKRLELKKIYDKERIDINPLVLAQIPNSETGDDKKDFIESFLGEKGITKDNGKLAVWLTDEKINQEAELITKNDDKAEFLIFKQAIDTGWDCPRAQILVKFRETKSLVFEIQTVGRILRMPEAFHYKNDVLNKAFVYTNVKSFTVEYEKYNPNIIKSIFVKRGDIYEPLKLKSYYRNRIDYGDITASFNGVMDDTFCNYFGFKKGDFSAAAISKNLRKIKDKIDIENLVGKDEIILNKKLDAKLFDHLSDEKIKSDENFQAYLSADDKERAFENVIKLNLDGYAPKRSLPIVKIALYRWFKKYTGVNLLNGGIIYIQNITLNNYEVFGKLFDGAVRAYEPVKDTEIKEKIEEAEEWNNEWEISENRNYNPNTYKPFSFNLSLYKHIKDKKVYLNFDSEIEKEFIDFLEKHKEKILWWWQNGNEHMALNFGVKYNGGSTFQPDFLVLFKNGKLGVFDTKASGQREDENKLKAEALQKYIKEENKRKKKELIFGGLIVKEGEHFRINSDEEYRSFKLAMEVKEKVVQYRADSKSKKQKGWKYFEFDE